MSDGDDDVRSTVNNDGLTTIRLSVPAKRKQAATLDDEDPITTRTTTPNVDNSTIRCICGSATDDGLSIACDICERWCHAACFDIVLGEIPEEWKCWECDPRPVDRERAARLQKERLPAILEAQRVQKERAEAADKGRASTTDKKNRQPFTNKRRRRLSVAHPPPTAPMIAAAPILAPSVTPAPTGEDELLGIEESWTQSYVPISEDIFASEETRRRLYRQAQQWRGVSAFSSSSYSPRPVIRHLDPKLAVHPALSPSGNLDARPPIYGVHTTAPVPADALIFPYTSVLTSSSAYVSDSLNGYALMGHPKPFVHLLGAPFHLALDSRMAGNDSRFVRSGCKPNAVLRPLLCKHRTTETLTFGVFASRDLKENEEVVLGWEWDDGNVVHSLPAIIEDPTMFTPEEVHHVKRQVANILHTLGSTFTTCACGARARDCAFTVMADFVDGENEEREQVQRWGPSSSPVVLLGGGRKRGFLAREKVPWSGGMGGVEQIQEEEEEEEEKGETDASSVPVVRVEAASLLGRTSTLKGKEREMEVDVDGEDDGRVHCITNNAKHVSFLDEFVDREQCADPPYLDRRDIRPPDPPKDDVNMDAEVERGGDTTGEDDNIPPAKERQKEDMMPPKMRKNWIHRALEELRGRGEGINCIGQGPVVVVAGPACGVFEQPSSESPPSSFAKLSISSQHGAGTRVVSVVLEEEAVGEDDEQVEHGEDEKQEEGDGKRLGDDTKEDSSGLVEDQATSTPSPPLKSTIYLGKHTNLSFSAGGGVDSVTSTPKLGAGAALDKDEADGRGRNGKENLVRVDEIRCGGKRENGNEARAEKEGQHESGRGEEEIGHEGDRGDEKDHNQPTKVKLSLKDFALRKRKQREEERQKLVVDVQGAAKEGQKEKAETLQVKLETVESVIRSSTPVDIPGLMGSPTLVKNVSRSLATIPPSLVTVRSSTIEMIEDDTVSLGESDDERPPVHHLPPRHSPLPASPVTARSASIPNRPRSLGPEALAHLQRRTTVSLPPPPLATDMALGSTIPMRPLPTGPSAGSRPFLPQKPAHQSSSSLGAGAKFEHVAPAVAMGSRSSGGSGFPGNLGGSANGSGRPVPLGPAALRHDFSGFNRDRSTATPTPPLPPSHPPHLQTPLSSLSSSSGVAQQPRIPTAPRHRSSAVVTRPGDISPPVLHHHLARHLPPAPVPRPFLATTLRYDPHHGMLASNGVSEEEGKDAQKQQWGGAKERFQERRGEQRGRYSNGGGLNGRKLGIAPPSIPAATVMTVGGGDVMPPREPRAYRLATLMAERKKNQQMQQQQKASAG